MLEYRALGALEVVVDGESADLGGPRQRRLLTALLIARGTVVDTDRLIDAVFAGAPSPRAEATLRSYVTRLRRAIGAPGVHALQRQGRGYRLAVDDDTFDVARFEQLTSRGRQELVAGDAAAAVTTLREALGLWRGGAFEEFADEAWVQPEARHVEELRLVAHEHLIDAELECGRAGEVVVELERLVDEEPFRDGFRARLMLALYRGGRAHDALDAHRAYRERLATELGLDPPPELADLERRILAHDPTLRLSAPAGRPLRGYRLGERLGRGRLGTVHAARLPGVARDYAIRRYPPDVADDPAFVRSFEADARRLASLDHPAIVTVHDAWREPGAAALVMRRMPGGTLRDRLERGRLSREEAAAVFERVGAALVAADRRGLTHGNLRPGSVFFDAEGAASLSDFGVGACQVDGDDARGFVELVRHASAEPPSLPAGRADGTGPLDAVVDAILADLRTAPAGPLPPANPYVGLRAFDEADADRFFGRERLVDELVDRLAGPDAASRFVLVVGGSGSGKSSAVRAGLLPRFRRGLNGVEWTLTVLLPGTAPFGELAEALRRVSVEDTPSLVDELRAGPGGLAAAVERITPPSGRMLLVVDQLDELFSLSSAADRDPFLAALAHAVATPGGRLSVVATLRADHFDRPLDHPAFAAVMRDATVMVPTMTAGELETAITGPARHLTIESGLVAELVSSVIDQPAALPALQFTLFELAERGGDRLSHDGLAAVGGVDGAIAVRAEHLFARLSPDEQQVVRRIFERLVVVEPAGTPTRRRATRAELVGVGTDDVVDEVVEAWVAARLLTSDRHPETREPTVEVAHEAVLQRWPRLLRWIDDDRGWLRTLAQLRQATGTWRDLDHDPGALLRGARLAQALEATAGRDDSVPPDVRGLLDASIAARDAEAAREAEAAARQARANRRLRTQRRLLVAALLLAVIVGAVAVERQAAASRSAAAASRSAAAADARARAATTGLVAASDEALESDWSLALLLAAEAYRIDDSPATRQGLVAALTTPKPVPSTLHEGGVAYQAIDVDDDSGLAVVKEEAGPLHLVDADSGGLVGDPLPAPALFRVGGLDVHDGLVAAGGLAAEGSSAVVYDLDSRAQVAAIPAPPDESAAVAFSPDGHRLAVSGTGRVRLFDVADWSRTRTLTTGDDEPLRALSWDPDGTRLYAGGFHGDVVAWDVDPSAPARPARRRGVAVDPEWAPIGVIVPIPDSDLLAVTSFESTLYLIDADTLRIVEGPLTQDNSVTGLSVDPTTDRLAVAMVNQVAIWSLPVRRLPDGDARLQATPTRDLTLMTGGADAAFAPDGGLVTADFAGEVTAWELDPRSPLLGPIPDAAPGIPTFSPDGDVLAMWGGGEGVRLLDADTYRLRTRLDIPAPQDASIASVAFLPDARVAVAWCPDKDPQAEGPCGGRLAVFDRGSGRAVAGPVAIDDVVDFIPGMLAASVDGELLAVGYQGAGIEVRDAATLDVVHELDDLVRGGENWVIDTSFSPEEPRLFAASSGDDTAVWDLSGDDPEVVVAGRTGLSTRFAPDGTLVTSDHDGRLELRDPRSLDVLRRVEGLPSAVIVPTFTSDGSLMVTTDDSGGGARLWRLDGLALLGGPIGGVGGTIHPDGSTVVVGGDPVRRLPMDPDAWVHAACETAGRDLTREEWARYLGDEPYRRTCP